MQDCRITNTISWNYNTTPWPYAAVFAKGHDEGSCMLYIGPPVLSQPVQRVAFVITDDYPPGNGKKITAIIHFSNMKFSQQKNEMILLVLIRFHFFSFNNVINSFFFSLTYVSFSSIAL